MKKFLKENEWSIYMILFAIGMMARYVIMAAGHTYDFDSYMITGELAANGLDVYANSERYNYGPIFMLFQGLFYSMTGVVQTGWGMTVYRVLIVSLLTVADIGIMLWLEKHYGKWMAMTFFLNPVSIFITGFHNQIDNLAICLMLWAIEFYNEEEKIDWKDIAFMVCMGLSLSTKHVFFIFPMWILLSKKLPMIKRILYAFVPPALFVLSFVPPIIKNFDNFYGILGNVFLYRSSNNFPLFRNLIFIPLGIPRASYTVIFILIVCVIGYLVREQAIEYRVLMYLMSFVAFASAVSNQYLAIPMAALCVLGKRAKYVYMAIMAYFLVWDDSGFGIKVPFPDWGGINNGTYWGYFMACFMLAIVIVLELRRIVRKSVQNN